MADTRFHLRFQAEIVIGAKDDQQTASRVLEDTESIK
jgi:hypothetical protein